MSVRPFPSSWANFPPDRIFTNGVTPPEYHCARCNPYSTQQDRLVDILDPHRILVYVDGACSNNGYGGARGGCGVVYTYDRNTGQLCGGSTRLESTGPYGDMRPPTSNRAELRAVLIALSGHNWAQDNVRTLVIATDSEYVAKRLYRMGVELAGEQLAYIPRP